MSAGAGPGRDGCRQAAVRVRWIGVERRSVPSAAKGADALGVCGEQRAQRQPVIDRSVHNRFDRGDRGAPVSSRTRRWSWEECVIFSSPLSMVPGSRQPFLTGGSGVTSSAGKAS
ncbi:hypothetical protein GCM10010303_40030 [Streptomyces purpurascens]|nr:hypothetical protein GCM10010303_40030 [Streptomyces purpurascens]